MESQPNSEHFLSKMVWNNQNNQKVDDLTLNMMPPRTTLVPIAQRRSSTLLDSINSPLKTELMDENSQNSLLECHNKFRPIKENSMDSTNDSSNFHCDKSNESLSRSPQDRLMGVTLAPTDIPTNVAPLQGVDLTLKGHMAINDLADTQPPSLATLLKFGVTENTNMPLPAQTGQSVENFFLTTLENQVNKPTLSNSLANVIKTGESKMAANLQSTANANPQEINVFNSQINSLSRNSAIEGTKLFTNNDVNQKEKMELINQLLTPTSSVEPPKMFQNPSEISLISNKFLAPTLKNDTNQNKIEVISSILTSNQSEAAPKILLNQEMSEILQNESQNQIFLPNHLKSVNDNSVTTQSEVIKSDQILQAISNDLLSTKSDPNLLIQQTITHSEQIFPTNSPEAIKTDIILNQSLSLLPTASPEIITSTVLNPHTQEIIAPNLTHSEILNPSHSEILLNNPPPLLSQSSELVLTPQPDITLNSNLTSQVPPVICQESLLNTTLNNICPQNPLETCLPNHQVNLENSQTQALTLKSLLVTNVLVEKDEQKLQQNNTNNNNNRQQGCEMLPPQITNMSENDLIRYINPQCFEGTYTS